MKKHLPSLTIFFILFISAWVMITERWEGKDGQGWKEQFSAYDARGYYAYLPEVFLKHDLSNQNPNEVYVNKTPYGKSVNKYFIGNAICWSPFFGAAALYTMLEGEESDGYTEVYKKSISIAGLFWLCAGLLCLAEMLKMLGITEIISGITLLLITLGTNLFYYATLQPTMSHLYSFSLLSIMLCFGFKYFRSGRMLHLYLFLLAFSLSILIRPANLPLILCLLPWMSGGFVPLIRTLQKWRVVLLCLIIPCTFVFLQCLVWHFETGHWFVRTYVDEGFYFLNPRFWEVLFGFRKGWFVYTPLAFLAMGGFIPLWKKDKKAAVSLLAAFLIHTYLVSSWWCWSFADTFGHRAFIDLYALVAILMAFALQFLPEYRLGWFKKIKTSHIRLFYKVIAFLLLSFNLLQTYQYQIEILPQNNMDLERYQYNRFYLHSLPWRKQ